MLFKYIVFYKKLLFYIKIYKLRLILYFDINEDIINSINIFLFIE